MSENYFYSSLSGQEIENTLLGAVRFNTDQYLTTSQKALARQNIGAGEANTQIKIKGFYDTLSDLQQQIPVGNEGDIYAVGTESPYDIYIWDAVHSVWVNNGPISFSDAIIDDNDVSTTSVWSSSKTTNEIAEVSSDVDAVEDSLATYTRPNLLDNWYFGPSFPINQRGQSSYTGTGYGIDRWRTNFSGDTVGVNSSRVRNTVASTSAGWHLHQIIPDASALVGLTVTASFIFSAVSGNYLKPIVSFRNSSDSEISALSVSGNISTGLVKLTGTVPSGTVKIYVGLYASSGISANTYVDIVASKLEIGSTQTLAHQSNGSWVLNSLPNYQEELAKCQRYFVKFHNSYVCFGYLTADSKQYMMSITTPVPMKSTPTPELTNWVGRLGTGGYSAKTPSNTPTAPTSLDVDSFGQNEVVIKDTVSSASDTNNIVMQFKLSGLTLSCEP